VARSRAAYGVDGCRGGWFHFYVRDRRFEFGVSEDIDRLLSTARPQVPILIDMPIGLTSGDPPVRACDMLARRALGRRGVSVFPAPCRAALECQDYGQASRVNHSHTGRKLSRQTWGLMPRIRELDRLLARQPGARDRLMEAHPELCLWGFAGGTPMRHNKKTGPGFEERLAALREVWPVAPAAIAAACCAYPATRVARDDVVDALTLALAASLQAWSLATLPERPEMDAAGLPMRICYPRPAGDGSLAD
jgi:predicted RNase H-like nuclease